MCSSDLIAIHIDDLQPYTRSAVEDVKWSAPEQQIVISYDSITINVIADELLPTACLPVTTEDQILLYWSD